MNTLDIISSNYSLSNGEEVIINSSCNNVTITLPKHFSSKLILNDINCDELTINLEESANLSCDLYQFSKKKIKLNFVLNSFSTLALTTISCEAIDSDVTVDLNGVEASFKGRYLALVKSYASNINTYVNHNAKMTTSQISNYGISLEKGGLVFKTTGHIFKGMSKSKCEQLSRGIIASNNAYLKALPILLIDEYDVNANHGASIGKMSDDELFYLMSRGLSKQDAFKLILSAIINPFIDNLLDDSFKEKIKDSINRLI